MSAACFTLPPANTTLRRISCRLVERPTDRVVWSLPLLCGACVVMLSVGCKQRNAWETAVPASGTITYKGKGIENADITLFPTDKAYPETVRPRARSTAGGSFVLSTYQDGDGAPVGSYKATVVHNEVTVSKDTIVAKPNDLPVKYSKLESTDLDVTIAPGTNEINLELK